MNRVVIGIDPSLSATGVVALRLDGSPAAWRLAFRCTVRPPSSGSLVTRLEFLAEGVQSAVEGAYQMAHAAGICGPTTAAAEDPSDTRIPGKGGPSQRFRFGAGAGVALLAAARACRDLDVPFTTYGVNEWIPKQGGRRGGGWKYLTPHAHMLAQTRRLIPGTAEATDDETMAAALALTHVLRDAGPRLPKLRSAGTAAR